MCRNTHLYLKSNSGVFDTDSRFYRFDLVNPIVARKGELINVRATEIEVPISYYNITEENNYFKVTISVAGGGTNFFQHEVPIGNYTATELETELNTIGNIALVSDDEGVVNYNITFTFTARTSKFGVSVARASGGIVNISTIEYNDESKTNYIGDIIGIPSQRITGINQGSHVKIADNVCDLNVTNNIYLETDLLLESRNTKGEKSGILAKIQMAGGFFSIVHYQNNDGADILLDKKDIYLDHINLRLVGDNQSSLIDFNGAEWTATLLFSFMKRPELTLGTEIETERIITPLLSNIADDEDECYYSDNSI